MPVIQFASTLFLFLSPTACGEPFVTQDGARSLESTAPDSSWSAWRGPNGTGVAPGADPPIEWSEKKNVRWKTELPGIGHSSPVIAGERVFLTAAFPIGEAVAPRPETAPGAHNNVLVTHRHRFVVLGIDRASGDILWTRALLDAFPHEGGHSTGTYASGSPITDGEHVFAFFGSNGLFALDVDGELLWKKEFEPMRTKHSHGEGSSPALFGESLIVNWDHEGASFVAVFDKRTGEERWRAARDELTSWTSPIVVVHDGQPQVVVSGTTRIRSYDLETGSIVWECGGLSRNVVATPVAADGMVFAASSYEKQAMLGIRLAGAKGDLSDTDNVAWIRRRATPYVPSPLLFDDGLYILHHYQGFLARLDPKTGGQATRSFRIEGVDDVYASPVGVAAASAPSKVDAIGAETGRSTTGRIYVTDRSGMTVVLTHEPDAATPPRVLARNRLNDRFSASAAIVGDELFLRGERFLYCIAR